MIGFKRSLNKRIEISTLFMVKWRTLYPSKGSRLQILVLLKIVPSYLLRVRNVKFLGSIFERSVLGKYLESSAFSCYVHDLWGNPLLMSTIKLKWCERYLWSMKFVVSQTWIRISLRSCATVGKFPSPFWVQVSSSGPQ